MKYRMKILDYDIYHNVKSPNLNNQYDIFNVISFIQKMLPDGIINNLYIDSYINLAHLNHYYCNV